MDSLIPTVDVKMFLEREEGFHEECKKVAETLHNFGVIIIRDPRVNEADNDEYCEMVENYFGIRGEELYKTKQVKDMFPEKHFQVGITPEKQEKARNHCTRFAHYTGDDKPISECPPEADEKWRFFWNIGERPADRKPEHDNVHPEEFPEWETKMNKWGFMMLDGCFAVAQMAAIGMGLEENTFYDRMQLGNHILAPTGSDLKKNDVGTVFAGVHYDLNFLTIHGKSPFPGLFIWTREGKRMAVRVPTGCLLLQAGIQFERLTGGYVMAGFHEVIYTEKTKEKVQERVETEGDDKPIWRVSSTLFSHMRYDVSLKPLEEL